VRAGFRVARKSATRLVWLDSSRTRTAAYARVRYAHSPTSVRSNEQHIIWKAVLARSIVRLDGLRVHPRTRRAERQRLPRLAAGILLVGHRGPVAKHNNRGDRECRASCPPPRCDDAAHNQRLLLAGAPTAGGPLAAVPHW